MRVFIDTEFTDFINCDMISIGLMSIDGHECYVERTDYKRKWCNQFVQAEIVPTLGKPGVFQGTKEQCRQVVQQFLESLPYDQISLVADYHGDFELIYDLFDGKLPMKCNGSLEYVLDIFEMGTNQLRVCQEAIEQYFVDNPNTRHNALHDAKANRIGWLAGMKQLGAGI